LSAAENSLAVSPGRITGESDRFAGPTCILHGKPPTINDTAFEDIGMNSRGRRRLARSVRVPWMMLPGRCGRVSGIRVVPTLKIDIAHGSAFLEHKGSRLPSEISLRIDFGVSLLPTPACRNWRSSLHSSCGGNRHRQCQQRKVLFVHGPIVSVIS